jgi:aldehyde dehydrogenase family 7 protein A1
MATGSDLLINDSKYSWLKELGLQADNPGVFDGTWHASGPVSVHIEIYFLHMYM